MPRRQHSSHARDATSRDPAPESPAYVSAGEDTAGWAIVSSRLGRPPQRQRRWFAMLERAVLEARRAGASLLVAQGIATEPWLKAAARLYRVPLVPVRASSRATGDREVLKRATRVVGLRVRRGGRIEDLLHQRVSPELADTYVGVWGDRQDAAPALMAQGAIGWYLASRPSSERVPATSSAPRRYVDPAGDVDWTRDGQWLVHCTRGKWGPSPWENEQLWRDEVLLGGAAAEHWGPAAVLLNILRDGVLRGAPLTRSTGPVVCFSAVPLGELMARRTFRSHLGRWDYEPYGMLIRRSVLERLGARPVVYVADTREARLPVEDRWRAQSRGNTYDWTVEQEWRIRGGVDLTGLGPADAAVFVGDAETALRVAPLCRWPVIHMGEIPYTGSGRAATPAHLLERTS